MLKCVPDSHDEAAGGVDVAGGLHFAKSVWQLGLNNFKITEILPEKENLSGVFSLMGRMGVFWVKQDWSCDFRGFGCLLGH